MVGYRYTLIYNSGLQHFSQRKCARFLRVSVRLSHSRMFPLVGFSSFFFLFRRDFYAIMSPFYRLIFFYPFSFFFFFERNSCLAVPSKAFFSRIFLFYLLRLFAFCWLAFGSSLHNCCEQNQAIDTMCWCHALRMGDREWCPLCH